MDVQGEIQVLRIMPSAASPRDTDEPREDGNQQEHRAWSPMVPGIFDRDFQRRRAVEPQTLQDRGGLRIVVRLDDVDAGPGK